MPSQDLRRWAENQRAAAERERSAVRDRGFSPDPISAGFELIDLAAELYGWPVPEDPVTRREDELARERWVRLRRALGSR